MSPKALIEIYKVLWSLQTASGIELIEEKKDEKDVTLAKIKELVNEKFEKHRMEACESILLVKP